LASRGARSIMHERVNRIIIVRSRIALDYNSMEILRDGNLSQKLVAWI